MENQEPPKFEPLTSIDLAVAKIAIDAPNLTPTQVARGLGVKKALVTASMNKPAVRAYMAGHLDRAGATLEKSARVVAEAHDATKAHFFAFEGTVQDERHTIDHGTRIDAAELNLKIRGELKDGGNQVNLTAFIELDDQQIAAIADGRAKPEDFGGGSA